MSEWLEAESCARCGINEPVPGYEWCAECRPGAYADFVAKVERELPEIKTILDADRAAFRAGETLEERLARIRAEAERA